MIKQCVFLLVWTIFGASLYAQNLDQVVIPKKSEIFITLQKGIFSKTAQTGDKFSAQVEVPVTVDDQIVLPVGTYVIGHVVRKQDPGRLKGKAQLLLAFDTVILPSGITRKMRATVQSSERYEVDDAKETGEMEAKGSQTEEVVEMASEVAVTGAITGATVGIFRGGTLKGAGIGAGIGAAGGALLALLKKGEDVELPRGSSLTIQLQEAVVFVKPQKPDKSRPLKPEEIQ